MSSTSLRRIVNRTVFRRGATLEASTDMNRISPHAGEWPDSSLKVAKGISISPVIIESEIGVSRD
jgi:hypothetical protein